MDHKQGGTGRGDARVVVANRAQLSWDLINPDGWLAPDHRARLVVGFVETLDLTVLYDKIEAREGTVGRPAADPAVLFALWLLATMDGVGSARELDRLMVYGRAGGIAIYELLDVAERGAAPPAWVALYDSGLAAYRSRNFIGAIGFFQRVLDARPSDQPACMMVERCSQYLKSPPGADWEATNAMKAK